MKIANKTILLTGASAGMGRELAVQLAQRNNRLVLIARREKLLKELIDTFPAHPDRHFYFACDVADFVAVQKLCEDFRQQEIVFDCLILNAGIGSNFEVQDIDLIDFEKVLDVNFLSNVHILKYLLPPMINRHDGLIAIIASLAGYRGMPKSAPYAASKAALINFTESLRLDLWQTGIKVVLVSPGFVKTPMTDKNQFTMPFMIPVEKAARIIIRGLEKNERVVTGGFETLSNKSKVKIII